MAATAPLPQLPVAEQHAYDFWFTLADADRDGVVTPTEAAFLANSGLPRSALASVWVLCADSRGLSRQGFYRAMRCVALAQKGMDMNNHIAPNHFSVVGLPVLQNVPQPPPLAQAAAPTMESKVGVVAMPLPTPAVQPVVIPTPTPAAPKAVVPAPAPTPAPAPAPVGQDWTISAEERLRFETTFARADTDLDGFVTGDQARELFTRSQLPLTDLRKVWTLSDQDADQRLSKEEFLIAMFLITVRMKGLELPDTLPASLRASAAGKAPVAAKTPLGVLPSAPTSLPLTSSPSPTPTPTPASPAPASPVPASSPLTHSGSSGALLAANKIPAEELAQYGALFEQVDTDRDGFISGDQAKPILSMSNLPVPDLRQIWALADAGGDYRLDKPEFVIAMYLINRRLRTGEPIPDRLPASLMPTAVAYDLEPKAPAPAPAPQAAAPQASAAPLSGSQEAKLAAPPANSKANARNASRAAALERLAGSGGDRERTGSLSNLQAPASPVSTYATPPATPTAPAPVPAHVTQLQRTSSGYGSPAPSPLASPTVASPSAYFGAQDDFAREERLRGELDAKAAKAEAMRAQVAQGEQTKEMGVKRLEELSQKSTELDRILADMQQQLADQETAKSDILREYQDEYDKMQLNLKKLDSLKSTILSNEKIKESTLKKLEETAAQGAKLEAEAGTLEKKMESLTKDVREFQLKLDLEGTKKESAASKVDFLRTKITDLEEQRRKLDAQLQDRNKSFQSEDAAVQTLSGQITSATLLLEQQLAASKKISDDLNALKAKRQDMRNQLQELQTQQTTESERTAKLLDEMAKLREEVNRLKPQVKEASKRLQATQEQQKGLKTELADAKADLARTKDEFVVAQKSPRGDPKPLPAVPPKSATTRAVETLPKPAPPPAAEPAKPAVVAPAAKEAASPKKDDVKKPAVEDKKDKVPAVAAPVATVAATEEKRPSEDGKKDKKDKERSSRRSDRHGSHRASHRGDKKAKDGVDGGTLSGSPSNPFEAAKDAFANPFNFGSSASDDPFAAVADSDPFDFDVAEADPLSFSGVKGVNLSVLEPRETFAVDTKNPFGGTSADDFGGGGKFSFGAPGKGDDPFA